MASGDDEEDEDAKQQKTKPRQEYVLKRLDSLYSLYIY